MIALATTLILCAAPVVKNLSSERWNGKDNDAYNNAKYTCSHMPEYKDTPCVKSFTKANINHYIIVCGKKKD